MREKHLAEFAGLPSSACINGKGYILQGKSLKFLAVGFLADKRNQRRADCRDLVAKLSCHSVAVAGRAGARIRGAARTEDNGTGAIASLVSHDSGYFPVLCQDAGDRFIQMELYLLLS